MRWILLQPEYKYNVGLPLSLSHVATFLSEQLHEDVLCFDLNLQSFESVICYLKENKIIPDMFGISSTSMTKKGTFSLCSKAKQIFPNVKTIIGGASAQVEYQDLLNNDCVDFCYVTDIEQIGMGYSEPLTIADLRSLPGIAFIENGNITVNPSKSLTDLDQFPFPRRDLDFIHIEKYHPPDVVKELHPATLITSRGCPHHCTYCASARINGNSVIWRSAESVVEELDYLRNLGYNSYIFEDYEFLFNRPRARIICENLKKNNNKWILKTRVERINEKTSQMLAESGCLIVYIGVETLTEKAIQKAKNSTINVKSVKNAINLLKKYNIRVCASVQFGLPDDTEDEFINGTICFLNKVLDPERDMVQLHFTTLFPNTDLYHQYFDDAVFFDLHHDFAEVVAHGMEGYLMPHLTEEVVRRVYNKAREILGELLSQKAIWFN